MPNYGFGGYQYETSPRKLKPEYEPKKESYAKKKKKTTVKNKNLKKEKQKQRLMHMRAIKYISIIFIALMAISYRNSLINEKFNQNEKLKSTLAVTQKENEQLQVNIENSLNLNNIEKIAREKLGMQKLDNSQKVYVSLPKKDYVEPAVEQIKTDDEDVSLFEKIINFIKGN